MNSEKLIELIKQWPEIYDSSFPNYNSREKLGKIWAEIALAMGASEGCCKDKWHILRSNYTREIRKEYQRTTGSVNSSEKKWVHFENMDFLRPHVSVGKKEFQKVPKTEGPLTISILTENGNVDTDAQHFLHDIFDNQRPAVKAVESSVKRKRVRKPPEEPKTQVYDADSELDADKMFLLSLLPLMRQLPPVDNLDIRLEIHQMFKRKLYPDQDIEYIGVDYASYQENSAPESISVTSQNPEQNDHSIHVIDKIEHKYSIEQKNY